jgi:hypothetical protein
MAGFQADVLDRLARVVGGTVSATDAHFFSGDKAADGSGVSGLKGCWSEPPDNLQSTPIAYIEIGPFTDALLGGQGKEDAEDEVRIYVLVAPTTLKQQMGVLTPFRDSVPAAFRAHMQGTDKNNLDPIPDILDCFITKGSPGIKTYGGTDYLAWDFTCRVRRLLSVSYSA